MFLFVHINKLELKLVYLYPHDFMHCAVVTWLADWIVAWMCRWLRCIDQATVIKPVYLSFQTSKNALYEDQWKLEEHMKSHILKKTGGHCWGKCTTFSTNTLMQQAKTNGALPQNESSWANKAKWLYWIFSVCSSLFFFNWGDLLNLVSSCQKMNLGDCKLWCVK